MILMMNITRPKRNNFFKIYFNELNVFIDRIIVMLKENKEFMKADFN